MSGSPVSPPSATGHIDNPRWGRAAADRLAAAQQRLQRAKRGSKNRDASGRRWRPGTARSPTSARTFTTNRPARSSARYDLLVVEDLTIANMVRRAKPVPDPRQPGQFLPNGARAKSGLNRSISDAGWGQFVSILRAKAEDAGRTWIEVDPRHTSDGCENCGHAARGESRHPSGIRLPTLRASRTGRRTRRTQHPAGWTGPSRPSGVKRSWRLPAVREVTPFVNSPIRAVQPSSATSAAAASKPSVDAKWR